MTVTARSQCLVLIGRVTLCGACLRSGSCGVEFVGDVVGEPGHVAGHVEGVGAGGQVSQREPFSVGCQAPDVLAGPERNAVHRSLRRRRMAPQPRCRGTAHVRSARPPAVPQLHRRTGRLTSARTRSPASTRRDRRELCSRAAPGPRYSTDHVRPRTTRAPTSRRGRATTPRPTL
jgi:hypothetical protein